VAERNPQAEMPFLEHLEELRWRILYSLVAVTLGTAIGWFVVTHFDVLELLKRPIAPYLPGGRLTFTSPTEPFMLTLKLAFATGMVLASPVVIYQIWAFLAPALYPREKRLIVPALSVGVVLFLAGAAAGYLLVLPAALDVLFQFQREDLTAIITIDRYFGFAVPLILAFGLVTELPLVVAILAALGFVTPRFLVRNRRYWLVIAALGTALLTPGPDAVSMLLMLVPLMLLYEIGILAAWLAARRRARRVTAAPGTAALVLLLVAGSAGAAAAQQPAPRRPARASAARDTLAPGRAPGPTAADSIRAGQPIDTATARRLGLPTGPTRSFPAPDAVLDSLLRLDRYVATRYLADTLTLEGDSQVIVLRGHAFIEREGTQLEADSVRYREGACRLDAMGEPKLFDQSSVLVAASMRYDTCRRRGIVTAALTDFEQQGTDWFMRGNLAVDSGSTRLYGAGSDVTSCALPEPHYHFNAGKVKWLNRNVMVARPAVLYVRDVPILWMPFIFQDIRSGRRSGMLVPRFGLSDLVRTSQSYTRHVSNVGYYFVVNDYLDVLGAVDWSSGDYVQYRAAAGYRVLDRFLNGTIVFTRINQLDDPSRSTRIGWNHQQRFSSRSSLNVGIDYATSTSVIQQNTVNPFLSTAQLNSSANFDQRFAWGALSLGGTYTQNLQNDVVTQTLPTISLTPSPVNIGQSITWSPGMTFRNNQTSNNPTTVEVVGDPGARDTVQFDTRTTSFAFQTPLRIGRWNWTNGVQVTDQTSDQQRLFVIPDTGSGPADTLVYARTFSTGIDWQTGINLPQLFSGSWKLQPGVAIVNTTGAGPFMLRNQFSDGEFVRQGKRLQFSLGMRPTVFGFFPGVGPLTRVRHSFSPIVDYRYAPGAQVPEDYVRVVDPTGTALNARSDPQQTISVGLAQAFEGKLRARGQDTTAANARKFRLLSINTSSIEYNFEAAKQPGRTGWQTQRLTNSFNSDLVPGFQLSLVHNLWDGPVGYDSTRFDPFLENVSASFQISAATVRAVAGLFGMALGRSGAGEPQVQPAQPGQEPERDTGDLNPVRGYQGMGGYPRGSGYPGAFGPARGGGRGFTLGVQYSSSRTRETATPGPSSQGGQRNVNLNLGFSPTRSWSVSWTTNYDIDTERFGQHYLRFERDLHEWQASFAFVRSPNGNVAFNFYISLTDLPDIKFDYDQQTF